MRLPLLAILLALGCTKWSEPKTERARCVKLTHVPSTRRTDISLLPHVDAEGNVGVRPVVTTSGHHAMYVVEFECPHGRFHVDREAVWRRLHEGDDVVVTYREAEGQSGRFDFLDAEPLRAAEAE